MKKFILFTLAVLFFSIQSNGQKVALVLSGGGAKGLAHIGVLKALEENNIPIDYIVGTSMGAIVGGYYAAGYSPEEIRQIVLSNEFQLWINGKLDNNYNYYFHSKEKNADIFNIGIALDSGFNTSLNTNLASDISLNFAFAEHLSAPIQAASYDFDSLFVPFRALASEIFTQKQVVLDSGCLNDALRVSMTVPLVYRPIKINNKYLFDGGIYNNFPVNIAREEFHPDFVIGANVSEKVFEEYPYDEDEKLISQSLFLMLLDKSDPSLLKDKGIYLEPNVKGFNAMDFTKADLLIDSGYACTVRKINAIKKQVTRERTLEEVAYKRAQFEDKFKPLEFKSVKFHGFNKSQRRYLRNFFNLEDNPSLSLQEIKKAYYQIVSEEFFNDVYPKIFYDSTQEAYTFELYGENDRNIKLDFGGNISSRSISEIYIGLGYKTYTGPLMDHYINFYSGRFYQSVSGSSRMYIPGSNYLYIQPEVTINKWDYINSKDVLFEASTSTILKQIDRRYGLVFGLPLGLKYKVELEGAFMNNTNFFSNNGNLNSAETLDELYFDGIKAGFRIKNNNLNRKQFPSAGQRFTLSLYYFDGEEKYAPGTTSFTIENQEVNRKWFTASLDFEKYLRFSPKYSLGWHFNATASNQPFFSNYYSTLIMSPYFNPFPDSPTLFLQNFRAHQFLAGSISNVFTLAKNLDLRLEGCAFVPVRAFGQTDQVPVYKDYFKNYHLAGNSSLIFHSPVGPISANLTYYVDKETDLGFYFSIGYLLFNKRAMH